MLELAIQQSGDAASKASAEDASGAGKEGASAGILKVWNRVVGGSLVFPSIASPWLEATPGRRMQINIYFACRAFS